MHNPDDIRKIILKIKTGLVRNPPKIFFFFFFSGDNQDKLAFIVNRSGNALNGRTNHAPFFIIDSHENQMSFVSHIIQAFQFGPPISFLGSTQMTPGQNQINGKIKHFQHPINVKDNDKINQPQRSREH